ncbi:MAG: ribosomal-processing cysteine protease Prp [Bacillota bacterium]
MDEIIKDIQPIFQDKYDIDKEIELQRTILNEEETDPFIITFLINTQNDIYGFIAKGTTGFVQYGFDIIASAVSTLTVNTVHSINSFTDDNPDFEITKNYVKCIINGKISRESKLLLKSIRLGMQTIQNSYGEKFITIEEIKIEKRSKFFGLLS